jgi:hypothetical protein
VVVESEGLSLLGHSGGSGCSRWLLSLVVAVRVELVVD